VVGREATSTPEFRDYLQNEGSELVASTPEEFATFISAEVTKHAQLIKTAGLKPQ
jgi:tripartite-type tricarboxylate transporter receptor subunit TctC